MTLWPVGQAVKTPPFHGGNMGSSPVRVTSKTHTLNGVRFCLAIRTGMVKNTSVRARRFIADTLRGFPFKGVGDSRGKVRFRLVKGHQKTASFDKKLAVFYSSRRAWHVIIAKQCMELPLGVSRFQLDYIQV